ncbi:hypothetical protein EG329_010973 [Mollisiaceae sp. DMI_Dod_QoI]|nr:hypothetical protein EG329_010973 [Helotiales sp. DMI_Dod_QoI]
MAGQTEFAFSLVPGGQAVENNNYRTRDKYVGQKERPDVYDEGKVLNMQMSLVEVVHGTMDSALDCAPATLIIIDFRFISHDPSRRYQKATIELQFQATNDPQDLNPPEVFKIAPMGPWGLQKSEKKLEGKRAAKLDAGATFVANVSGELEWSMTTTKTEYDEATLVGMSTKRGRKTEPKNTAVWSMSENEDIERGIPSLLRTAILLKRQDYADFKCFITVETKVNWRPQGLSPSVESRKAGGNTDHVTFSPMLKRTKAPLAGIEPSELNNVVLTKLMAVTTKESIAPPAAATTLTDGQMSDLSLENVMRAAQKSEEQIPKAEKSFSILDDAHAPEYNTAGGIPSGTSERTDKLLQISDPAPGDATFDQQQKIGTHSSQKLDDSVPNFADVAGAIPRGLKFEEGSNIEETLRLLLHAVRKGVEVIAEAVRIPKTLARGAIKG